MKDGHNIKLANGIKNQLKGIGVKSNIFLQSRTIEELRKIATRAPVGFEIRADYNEISAGELLVNKLKDLYPDLFFNLSPKEYSPALYTENYMSIFLDTFLDELGTFPNEHEERSSTEPLNY